MLTLAHKGGAEKVTHRQVRSSSARCISLAACCSRRATDCLAYRKRVVERKHGLEAVRVPARLAVAALADHVVVEPQKVGPAACIACDEPTQVACILRQRQRAQHLNAENLIRWPMQRCALEVWHNRSIIVAAKGTIPPASNCESRCIQRAHAA